MNKRRSISYYIARTYFILKKFWNARDKLEEVLEFRPDFAVANDLIDLFEPRHFGRELGTYNIETLCEKVLPVLEKAIEIGGDNLEADYAHIYKHVLEADYKSYKRLGQILNEVNSNVRRGDVKKAQSDLEKAIEIFGDAAVVGAAEDRVS